MTERIGASLVVIAFPCALYFYGLGAASVFRLCANRKDDTPRKYRSAFNVIFSPSELTEPGLVARRKCIIAIAGFYLCFLVAAVGVLLTNK
jgi:hypothetical protein